MPTYPEYADQLSQSLIEGISEVAESPPKSSPDLEALVNDLVAAMPYYTNDDLRRAHVNGLCTQLGLCLPNNAISAQPSESSIGASFVYFYEGPYSGYQNAFFHGLSSTTTSEKIASEVSAADGSLNSGWWGNYCLALLTDTVYKSSVSVPINGGKLTDSLNSYNQQFNKGLAPSYLPVFTDGYSPTASAFKAIVDTGNTAEAAELLNAGIDSPLFQTNFNTIINQPGDGKDAAMWFLFNNWIALRALGYSDVDAAITAHKEAGLVVPDQLGPVNWWTGHYNQWYERLDGNDLLAPVPEMIHRNFEQLAQSYTVAGVMQSHQKIPDGYSISLCKWGSLAHYKP